MTSGGKALRIGREGLFGEDSHHLPVSGDGVFACRAFLHPAEAGEGRLSGRHALKGKDVAQPQLLQEGHVQAANCLRQMTQRVGFVDAEVAVLGGVGSGADSAAVHY